MANIFNICLVVLVLLYCYSEVNAFSRRSRLRRRRKLSPKKKREKYAERKLQKYGYYTSWVSTPAALKDALLFFQAFNNLPGTGKVNKGVLNKLKAIRCGIRDPVVRKKEDLMPYYTDGSTWRDRRLSWHWDGSRTNYYGLNQDDTYRILRKAFDIWASAYSGFVFKQKHHKDVDIEIKFVRRNHRCPFRGDGKGESIGHAFYPYANRGFAGDIHFDDAEKFTLKSTSGTKAINFLWAAAHELGHSLGLMHSHDPNSMMYPWYNTTHPVLSLHKNDISGIRSLYPPMPDTTKPATTTRKMVPTTNTKTLVPTTNTKTLVPTTNTKTLVPTTNTKTLVPTTNAKTLVVPTNKTLVVSANEP